MKLHQLVLAVLLAGLLGCQSQKNEIIISGRILGDIPEKVEYTSPINGTCNWRFTESVQPDSLGSFQICIESRIAIFVKLRTSYKQQGTIIIEPGKTYNVVFDLRQKENVFSVTDESSAVQEVYNALPNPFHIQIGAREFVNDSVASLIKETIDQRRTDEITEFEKLLSDNVITEDVFNLVKTDRTCYYDAVLATTVWMKNLMTLQGRGNMFNDEFGKLWKEVFEQPLFSNTKIVNSPWFNFYAECYIYFQEYIYGNYTKEKLEERRQTKQPKIYRVAKAKEYLPADIQKDYLAYYLNIESAQKKYEKELIDLFTDFEKTYPESEYIKHIAPLIEEIINFHKISRAEFSEHIHFVENYQELNSLAEVANTFDEGIIYVDVWTTSCGPCKVEFKFKEEVKKLLQEKGIKILYISIDRPEAEEQWQNMIKFYNLEGHHVRANKNLDADLRKTFDREGFINIPWYILMDEKGKIIKKHAKRPSQIKELEKEINSY